MNDLKFTSNIIIKGKIKVLTGLHIGGTADNFEIGGMDNPVIRDPITNLPYIPGSSLKGKLRVVLEWARDAVNVEGKPAVNDPVINKIFGKAAINNKNKEEENNSNDKIDLFRGRLIVRDAYPEGYDKLDFTRDLDSQDENILSPTLKMWKKLDSGLPYTEWKTENTINRITSSANPRSLERVPAGSVFEFEMIYTCYSKEEEDKENLKIIKNAFKLLEDDYLGGNGTRGYGKIKFEDVKFIKRAKEFYEGKTNEEEIDI